MATLLEDNPSLNVLKRFWSYFSEVNLYSTSQVFRLSWGSSTNLDSILPSALANQLTIIPLQKPLPLMC